MSGAPARGTVPRRPRRHHHHHHHQHQHHHDNNNREDEQQLERASDYVKKGHSKVDEVNRPKVNPIFLWALQREQRIIEVRCEDYDKRNRIKLTKTARGWRSIPRTASNVYATSLATNGHTCVERICESPAGLTSLSSATSSPNSSRWSPATISSSNLAPWSISSTRSGSSSRSSSHLAAILSPSQDCGETSRGVDPSDTSSIPSRSRIQSDGESINDFYDAGTRSTGKLPRIGKEIRKKRHRDAICTAESERTSKALNNTTETRDTLLLSTLNNKTGNNQNIEDDSTNRLTRVGDVSLERTTNDGRPNETRKKRKHERNSEIDKRKKRRRNSESLDSSAGLSVMSSPRSWERLMNGTRFLHSEHVIDQSRLIREHDIEEDPVVNESGEMGKEQYEKGDDSTVRCNHFGSIDLERAKTDQHLQPRVVLEQLRFSGTSDAVTRNPTAISYEDDMEKEATEEEEEEEVPEERQTHNEEEFNGIEKSSLREIDPKDKGRKKTVSISDTSEIRDILSMLDSTGSPVLATDTPIAHLPSSLDSTKTNISSCYGNRDYAKLPNQPPREEANKRRSPTDSPPTVGRSSAKLLTSEVPSMRSSLEHASRNPVTRLTGKSVVSEKRSDSPFTEKGRMGNGKVNRKENISEVLDSSSSELGTSSEILEALRSTPGLSVSVTTRPNPNEMRHESSENAVRYSYKRPASAVYLEKLLPNSPQQIRQSAPPTPCAGSSDVTCSQDSSNELTLETILATPARTSEKLSGPGLAAIVNRLSNRPNQPRDVTDCTRRIDLKAKDTRVDCLPGETTSLERRQKQNSASGNSTRTSRVLGKKLQPIQRHRNYPHQNHRSAGRSKPSRTVPPAKQLRHLMDNSKIPIPDPLLVPRDRLPALAAAPAIEIPKLLAARPELRLPEALRRPDLLRDPDLLVISLAHLQQVLDQGDGSVCEYTYRPPHPMALGDDDEEEFGEEDELIEQEDIDDHDEEEDDDEEEEDDVEDYEEEEDQDVPEQSLDLYRNESMDAARVRGIVNDKPRNQRRPPKLISCKPIGSLMPGPIDLSRNCANRSTHPNRSGPTFAPVSRQSDISTTQLPPPSLLRVRSGLLKQESEVSSTEIPSPCGQDDLHLWHPLFGSQKRQMQQQQQPPPQPQQQQQQQQQQSHRTPWHRTTLAS